MEYQSLRQFRADLKTAFDYVEAGAEEGDLTIERDGTVFKLVLESWKAPEEVKQEVKYELHPQYHRNIAKIKGECKNGHIVGKFGKCLEKGCKYS